MSVGVVNKQTGDRIPTAGDPLDKVGNLANLTTTAKDNAVNAINEVNATKANQTQLATVEASTTASKAYSANEYLVLGGVLYKVTANIAQGGTIVTEGAGKNVDLATVGGELSAINSNISTLESGLTNVADKLHGSILTYISNDNKDYIEIPATPGARYIVLLNTMGSSGINGYDTVIFAINAGYTVSNFNTLDIRTASDYVKEVSYNNDKYIIKEKKVSDDSYGYYLKALVIKTDG